MKIYTLLIILTTTLIGCTNSSNPVATSNNQTPREFTSGNFGYTLNGITFERSGSSESTEASASIDSNWGLGVTPGSWLLAIDLMDEQISIASFHTKTIELFVPFTSPVPGTYQITHWDDPANAQAAVLIDSFESDSRNGGTLTLTKFDTVNNLVSGTFSFTASLAKPTANTSQVDTVASGFFTDVGIYIGGYGQGTITATTDGASFTSRSSSALQPVSAFMTAGSTELSIETYDNTGTRFMLLSVDGPTLGTFDLSKNQNPLWAPVYSGPNNVTINRESGVTGSLTITQFDTLAHRMSGTFQFSGPDQSTGRTIQITNGVIDNVQWFVL